MAALLLALATVLQVPSDPPRLTVDLASDTVLIGEPFGLRLEVGGVRGEHVVFPELPDTGAITALGPRASARRGDPVRSAEYELVAWETGDLRLPRAIVRVESDGGVRRLQVPERTVHVRSVLPAGAEPESLSWRPARKVIGPNWSVAEKVLAVLAALALVLAVIVVGRRLRRSAPSDRPVVVRTPRERALESLDALSASDLLEIGELKAFYSELSHIVRVFLAESDSLWGLDLTTAELVRMVARDGVGEYDLSVIADLLVEADLVKFARRRPTPERGRQALERSRAWVAAFHRRVPEPEPDVAARDVAAGEDASGDAAAGGAAAGDGAPDAARGDPKGEPAADD